MVLTKNNLNEVIFENEDAKLLILDVVSNTVANIYYFHGAEITVIHALKLWKRAYNNKPSRNTRLSTDRKIMYLPHSEKMKEIAYRWTSI